MRSNWCVLMLLGLNLIWVGMGMSGKSTLVMGTPGWVWSGCIVRSLFGMRILWSGIGIKIWNIGNQNEENISYQYMTDVLLYQLGRPSSFEF